MRNTLVPVLLLATVALSSSNVLPILSMSEFKSKPLGYDGHNDNTFSNKYNTRRNLNELFNIAQEPAKQYEDYSDVDNFDENYNSAWKNDNYDLKGFRQEQWHNYPRQLDRLNRNIYEDHDTDKRNLDPDDPRDYTIEAIPDIPQTNDDISSNEIPNEDTLSLRKAETAAAIINPLIILKIHLACLRKNKEYQTIEYQPSEVNDALNVDDGIDKETNYKVKREEKDTEERIVQNEPKTRTMNKRIFSLWSRLQSLNHRGHELHHRRHLYALYGLPDSEASGVLTAETRATFMRPPGSPLRWG